jgi:phosphohistidine phosphatase
MKTLYIVRHAKSSWEYPHLSDHDRPLLSKGKKRTKLIGQFMVQNNIFVDQIISSSAVRAYETAKIIAKSIGYPVKDIKIDSNIYHTDADSLVNGLYGLSNDIQSVMYFGHNPTFTYFANEWLDDKIDWLPTSAVAGIDFDTDNWKDLASAKFETKIFMTPRMLKE